MGKLDGKVAVIIGGTSGMALETAKLFVEEGAHVFVTGRRQEKLDAAVAEIGHNVTGVQGDLAKMADLDRLFETVRDEKGHIDVLFVSAGSGHLGQFVHNVTEQVFHDTFVTNVKNVLFAVQKALSCCRFSGQLFKPAWRVLRTPLG